MILNKKIKFPLLLYVKSRFGVENAGDM